MHFTKMHGQGNDFVMVGKDLDTGIDLAALSPALCDRHKGVGADGVIAVLPSESGNFRMQIFNTDGSEPEMCGNGVRCAVKYWLETMAPDSMKPDAEGKVYLGVETLAGLRTIVADFDGTTCGNMTVDMGAPILKPADVPVKVDGDRAVAVPIDGFEGAQREVTCVSMGNPHAVLFINEDPNNIDISKIGAAIENHSMFPNRTNVEFVHVVSRSELIMRVWERGCGETLACGTGACATLVAAVLNGHADRSAVIRLRGGDLQIKWRETGEVLMTGPASTVFEGDYLVS